MRLEGEEGESLDPRAFVNQRLRTRLRILLAGVVMNFLLAWLIFTLIALLADPVWDVRIDEVQPDSPAATAGLVASRVIGETEPIELVDADGQPTGETGVCPSTTTRATCIIAIDGRRFPVFDDIADDRSDPRSGPLRYLRGARRRDRSS